MSFEHRAESRVCEHVPTRLVLLAICPLRDSKPEAASAPVQGELGRAGARCTTGANREPADKKVHSQWALLLTAGALGARKIIMPSLAPIAAPSACAIAAP